MGKFCGKCGAPLGSGKYCPQCGALVQASEKSSIMGAEGFKTGRKANTPGRKKVEQKQTGHSGFRKTGHFFAKCALILLETMLLIAVALYGAMYVLAKGPSPTARDMFVRSVRETSAVGFLANLFFTDEEIAQIEAAQNSNEYVETDTSLINIPTPDTTKTANAPVADDWELVDEDGDGIIIDPVKGEGYSGYMMVVLDPSRVIMGCVPESFGGRGYRVAEMAEKFDAVAGINAGGFDDPNGMGNGSMPDSIVVRDGKLYCETKGVRNGFVGFDADHIMHTGYRNADEIREAGMQEGVCFGPVLVANGEPADPSTLASGINPRTAIGQRSDGAVLMLVIDGRQVISIGASQQDLVDIMLEYGAVNACNLDGGSSAMMWYNGEYVNNCASVIGIRPVPTTFLVLKEGTNKNG